MTDSTLVGPLVEGAAVPRWKRLADLALAAPLAVLAAPVVLGAAALVRATSPGPGIYTQTRLGLNRRPFTIYKIRSMRSDSEAGTGPQWATKNDARVTRLGRFLRATHIDELPQLWNVMRGEMSLVGPRPERPEIIEKIEPQVPGFGARLAVLPGVTGLAQVQLPPDTTVESVRRKVRYDAHYAANMGLWLDLRLIAVTAFKVVGLAGVARFVLRVPGEAAVEPERAAPAGEATSPYGIGLPHFGGPEPDLSQA